MFKPSLGNALAAALVVPAFAVAEGGGHGIAAHGTGPGQVDEAVHIRRTGTVAIGYPPHQAIRLFTAQGERLWLGDVGWNPDHLRGDGFTPGDVFAHGGSTFVTVTFDEVAGKAQYLRVAPGKTAAVVDVTVTGDETGSVAHVAYVQTSLSGQGAKALGALTDEAFAAEMKTWQTAIEVHAEAIRAWFAAGG